MAKSEIISGTSPIGLNSKGRDQAHMLADHIATHGGLHLIISSDLPRAMETAQIIHEKTKAPIHISKGLHPWHLGALEGQPEKESEAIVQHHARSMPWAPLPGKSPESGVRGESFNTFHSRLKSTMDELQNAAANHPNLKLGAVTHSRTIHLIRAMLKGKKSNDGSPDMDELFKSNPAKDHLHYVSGNNLMPFDKEEHSPSGLYLIRHTATADDQG